ncbi:MAG TPA: 16S rRNA (adenine(1518)-N(6)/adenine(1519)-N(6))-dimethyltransferase RsmA [Candidatus Paceibacterota bacterium]|nr:16S rRNA (adenine(1518)-N(6)/adenine(1519)-N(6))-dimethyltransferase RsmA [Candidatus Paceibacterota bacterium]
MFAKKSLGQNFLMHRQTAERIVAASGVPAGSRVLEIGPGTGMLTRELLNAGLRVLAVEADNALAPELEETFSEEIAAGKLTVLHADIRNFATETIAEPYHIIANIPYYITGEIIRQFLTAPNQPRSMTLLVQKEVAERVAREKKGSLLSLSIKAFGTPSYAFTVPRGAFRPAPKVDSAVLVISDIGRSGFEAGEEERFFAVLRAGFAHKRKRLLKNLEEYWPKEAVREAAEAADLSEDARAEELSLAAWRALAHALPGV